MERSKFKIKLTRNQLTILYGLVTHVMHRDTKMTMQEKLVQVNMIDVHKRLLVKWTYPEEKQTLSLPAREALAIYACFGSWNFEGKDALVMATMQNLLAEIHRFYA